MSERFAPIGGQAVIEGVMMRSPSMVATAVRRPDGSIAVKRETFVSWSRRLRLLGVPIVRGAVALIESLQLGMTSITYSAEVAVDDEKTTTERSPMSRLAMAGMMLLSFGLGLLIFFWLPLVFTDRVIGIHAGGFAFNAVDGLFRLVMLLLYLTVIGMWGEMRRVFQYHGAEHKSIAAVEAGDELTPERVARYSRFHPRCGTSFLLMVMVASIFVFMLLGRPETIGDRLQRFLLIPLIGGVSYEIIRLSGRHADHPLMRLLIAPGLWLQRITTREPSLDQLEVAIRSIEEVTERTGGRLVPL